MLKKCRSCQAEIDFIVMASGKKMPVDRKSVKVIVKDTHGGRVVDGYISHFSTCPFADRHRKGKTNAGG